MPTQFRLPANVTFSPIRGADHKRLYVAEIGSTFELAVGFTIREYRTGIVGTGLLYLSGDSFGKIALFLPDSSEPNFGVRAHALDSDWHSVEMDTLTEGPTAPTLYSLGILPNRENMDVFVKEGTRDGLQPLFVDLRELDLHRSGQNYERGFSFVGVRHQILNPESAAEIGTA